MTRRALSGWLACILLATAPALAEDGKDAGYYKTFIIEIDHGSDSDGEVTVTIEPYQDEEIVVTVPIRDGTRENKIANLIEEALKERLKGIYYVERDDWEKVIIRRDRGSPRFKVTVASNLSGVALELRGR